ncbi:MAG: chorismate mutase [Clostridia bacterium]|nr:chorismate mutase [Clostridia bacterium]
MNSLEKAREIINETDNEIARLFCKRMEAAAMIAQYKKEHALPIFDAEREEEILRKSASRVEDEQLRSYYINFMRDTMKVSRAYQSKIIEGMKVAFSGTIGAFGHIATRKLFPSAIAVPYPDFISAYKAVESGECDAAVLPVENSYNGEVGQVTDLLFSGSLFVNCMTDLEVSHDLLVCPSTKKEQIKTVVSHPQALAQCAKFIRDNGYKTIEYENTALAAQYVAELNDTTVAAIASEQAADFFSLTVLERNINASRANTTKFAALSRSDNIPQAKSDVHSILLFTVRNEAGSLAKALDIIGLHGFNMRTLRSRPMKELLWQYYFYLEIEGDVRCEAGENMIRMMQRFCDKLKVAGTYVNQK